MGHDTADGSSISGKLRTLFGRKAAAAAAPDNSPMTMLGRLHAGEHPDYCLYLRPPVGNAAVKDSLLSIDLEELLIQAFAPLPVVTLDENAGHQTLPDETFLTLAHKARVLCLVPTHDPRFVQRLGLLKAKGPIGRCIFVMPEKGTIGQADWSIVWPPTRAAAEQMGIELSAYTAGGWLFRLDTDGKACTFRPIVNPNAEKIALALEAICMEMPPAT